jgi:23S rRNA (adenine2503-C2)-methyltransferase
LKLLSTHNSKQDGSTKLIFETENGEQLETVILRIATGRTSLCISSQIGCAVRCRFCATGNIKHVTNLTTDQILDQVIQANIILESENRRVQNIVFMGMGEPLHNYNNVKQSLYTLLHPKKFNYSPRKLILSTVGIIDKIKLFKTDFPAVGLALSLHSADEKTREQLIPFAKNTPLASLRKTLEIISKQSDVPIMIEYLMLQGITDREKDINLLSNFLKELPIHINLIPYNETPTSPFKASSKKHQKEFSETLKSLGFKVTLRYSLGTDIAAACGQLANNN